MDRSINDSKRVRDYHAGHNLAAAIPIPELISLQGSDVRARFRSLENDDQRSSFLDAIIAKLDSNLGNWATFYEAVDIVRANRSYWEGKGYSTFDVYWHDVAGPCFQSFKELEDIYCYAKTACPELFHLDFDAARSWAQQLSELRAVPALNPHGGRIKKRHYADRNEARAAVVQASKWYNAGGNSLEYRLARLKRDHPEIAAAVLAGRYFKRLGTGRIGIDMVAAERDAYGERPKHRVDKSRQRKKNPAAKLAMQIRALSQSSVAREFVVAELSGIRWLVAALVALEKRRTKRP